MSKRWKRRGPGFIRVVLVALGVWLLFFTPDLLAGKLLPKIGGFLATLSGVLGHERMGQLNTAVLLSLVYLLTICPVWLISKLGGNDPLAAPEAGSLWVAKPPAHPELSLRRRMRFQF